MKNFYLIIIYGLILVLSILCIKTMKTDINYNSNNPQNIFVVYNPNNNIISDTIETFSEDKLLQVLQPQYKLGYNGTYEPASLCSQPITALPFNEGLKPCTQIIPV